MSMESSYLLSSSLQSPSKYEVIHYWFPTPKNCSAIHGKLLYRSKRKKKLKMMFHSLDDEKDGELEIKELVVQLKEKFDITVRLSEME